MEETTNESTAKIDKSNLENQLKGLDISDSALKELDVDLDNEISDEVIDKYVQKLKGSKKILKTPFLFNSVIFVF